jgi:DNA-binding NarL/FixJ family response regulator
MSEEMIRLLIVDDQRMFSESIKYVIESRASDIQIVGIANNGREALHLVDELNPHIVLLDVRMPEMDGVEAARLIGLRHPKVKVLMLTTFADDEYVQASLKYGAVGYLLKNRPPLELINSIHAVMGGTLQIDPAVARSLIRGNQPEAMDGQIVANLKTLTHREKEVLSLMVQAFDNRRIASSLLVAEQTVRNYISTIYSKLGVSNRMDVLRIVDKIHSFLDSQS